MLVDSILPYCCIKDIYLYSYYRILGILYLEKYTDLLVTGKCKRNDVINSFKLQLVSVRFWCVAEKMKNGDFPTT